MEKHFTDLVQRIGKQLQENKLFLVTAESCTGGQIAQILTSLSGCSKWFDRGYVTYSNKAKMEMLAIKPELIQQFGAVSQQTSEAMAMGALHTSQADVALSVTGIAGPDGGTPEKPVGLVWFAWVGKHFALKSDSQHFKGNREQIRTQASQHALEVLLELISA